MGRFDFPALVLVLLGGAFHEALGTQASSPLAASEAAFPVATADFTARNVTDAAVICPELLYFLAASQASQLTEFLSSADFNYTVIAPSNQAFTQAVSLLGGQTAFLNSIQLGGILAYHILKTEGIQLADGVELPSLYYDLPVRVRLTENNLTFVGGGNTSATAFFRIPTPKGSVFVVDSVLDRRLLLPSGVPGSAFPTDVSVAQANKTLTMLPEAEAKAAALRGLPPSPAPLAQPVSTGSAVAG